MRVGILELVQDHHGVASADEGEQLATPFKEPGDVRGEESETHSAALGEPMPLRCKLTVEF